MFFYEARNKGRFGKPVTGWRQGSSRLQRSFERRPQDHQRWSTRLQRRRLIRRGDALAGACSCRRAIHGSRAGGLTTHCLCTPRNAREIGRIVRDSLCTGAQEVGPSGRCGDCGDPPLRVGWQQCFCVDPSQRPSHKTHIRGHRKCGLTHALHHILCSIHVQRAQVQPHDVSQQCHSARAARSRTSDTRDTSQALHHKPPFLKRPPPPRPSSLERHCVGPSGGGNSASAWILWSAPATKHTQEDTESAA